MVLPDTDQSGNYTLDGLGNWRATGFMPVGSPAQVDQRNNNYVNQITRRSVAGGAAVVFQYDSNSSPLHSRLYFTQDADWNTTAVIGYDSTTQTWGVVQRYVYSPYGSITVLNSDWSTPAAGTQPLVNNLYQGMTLDAVTGLCYDRARDYLPSLGRWIEQDPAQFINGANTYQFVDSSPVGNVDASGLVTYHNSLGSGVIGSQIRVNAAAKVFTPLYTYGPVVGKFKLRVRFSFNQSGGLPKVVADDGSVAGAGGWGGAAAGGSAVIGPNPVEYDGHRGYFVKWNPLLDRSTPLSAHFGIALQDGLAGAAAGAAVGAVTGPGDALTTTIGGLAGIVGGFIGSFFSESVATADESPAYTIRVSGTWFVWQDCKTKTVHIVETAGAVEATSKTLVPTTRLMVEKQ
ncbi:MAG: RHS repeat-associated core domain-containing protein [Phycisphaerae bacterium]